MGGLEQFPGKREDSVSHTALPSSIEEYRDNPELFGLLLRIPSELRPRHIAHLEKERLDDEEASAYLKDILEKREAASRESVVSDVQLQPYFEVHGDEIWKELETKVFTDTNNLIGRGNTARIKRLTLGEDAPMRSLAIKYLVTPTEKTLSVSGEHDLIREVERLQKIEEAESAAENPTEHLKVPHPYFYHRNAKTQCYGMEEIDGTDLEGGTEGIYRDSMTMDSELKKTLRASLKNTDRQVLLAEVDRFFDAMHTVCLHGDVKPKNIMVSREGQFYLIDFGQSVLATSIDEKSGPAFENLKDEEKKNAKQALTYFLEALYRD